MKTQTVTIPGRDAPVTVRQLRLTERLELVDLKRTDADRYRFIPELLARTVRNEDGSAVFDAAGWDEFGAEHFQEVMDLFRVAFDLSDFGGEAAAKNSEAPSG